MASALPPLELGDTRADLPAEYAPRTDRALYDQVRGDPTVQRPLVVRRVATPVAVFERLLEDLPGTARLLDTIAEAPGRYRIEAAGEGCFEIADGHGAQARVSRIVLEPGARAYIARGSIQLGCWRLFGTGVVTLRFEADGAHATRTGGQIHFRIENALLHVIGKTIAPLVRRTIDERVKVLVESAIAVCERAARAPAHPAL